MVSPTALHGLLWAIFAVVYVGMALGRLPGLALDRTGIALIGAILMIACGGISLIDAARAVSFETILLLFGLMLFSVQLRQAGFYAVVGRRLARATDQPRRLLAAIILVSAVLSALLANDIVCLAFTPVLCQSLLAARRDPIPYLIALATSSNIGSAATVIGNPQNMYIGVEGHLAFAHFTLVMLPVTVVGLALCWGMVVWLCGRSLREHLAPAPENGRETRDGEIGMDAFLVGKTLAVLVGLIVAFLVLGPEARVVAALVGGAFLLISRNRHSARLYAEIDWNLLLLFFGLFVVNGTMKEQHLMEALLGVVRSAGVNLHQPWTLSAVTVVLSNVVSNVPAVLLLQPSIPPHSESSWYLLAMASTLAGNLTLVGSIANLIVAEQAARFDVKLDLKRYCAVGIPLTLLSVTLGTAWVAWAMSGR